MWCKEIHLTICNIVALKLMKVIDMYKKKITRMKIAPFNFDQNDHFKSLTLL